MKNPFTRLFRARDKPGATDSVSSAPTFYFGSSAAGKSVTASTAIQMSTVYACVRVIAETIASLPLHVYQNQGEGSVKALDHPLYPILHDEPNSEMTSFVWRETMLAHLLLWGNAYCQIIRSGRSQILGLYPLLPDRMEVDRDSAGTLTYTYSANSGQTVKLRPEDVLHMRTVNRKDAEAKVLLWLERCHARKQGNTVALPAAAQCESPGVPADQLRRRLDLIKPNDR